MASFYVWVTFGLCLLKLCLTETQFNVSCRYRGVFHVEKNGRYSLTRTEAADLCRALNSTLSTLEQLEKAHELGFETCRYGFIVGHIAIPRINPYHLCAANHTGIYKLSANTTGRYDAYCYNATETRDKACEPIERIDTSFLNNQSEIVIDNEDGSRYNADGTRHSGDSSTSGVDDENVGSGSSHDTTPVDTSIKRSSPSYYGSVTPVSHLSDHSSGGGEKDFPVKNSDDEISPTSTDISLVTGFNDFAKEDDEWHRGSTTMASSHGARQNDSAQDPLVYPGWDKGEDYSTQAPVMDRVIPSRESNHEKESSNTALATPDGARHEDSTQPPLSSGNEAGWGTEGITHPTDAPGGEVLHGLTPASTNEAGDDSLLMGTITESADIVSREEATKEPLAPSTQPGSESEQANTTDGSYVNLVPGVFSDIDDRHNQLQTPLPPSNEAGWGTEGITHPTDAPGGEVLHGLTPASTNEAGDDSLLMGTTVTASIDVLEPEDVTQEVWAPRVIVTALATPDGARHEDSTQPPLSSGNEAGWGTEGITHPTDAPGGEVLHGLTPASTNEAGDDSLLMGTITESADIVSREEATKEPLAPSTQPGSESEQANTTDGSYVNLVPGVFSDIDDRHNQLQTPLPPRSTSIIGGDHGSRKGNVEPTSNPGENATTTITSQPRSAQVPEWLIIVAALLALALILAVCIAVSSRRRCGQKKKLVINNGKGAVEDRKTSELNGDASKSQEMVHLVHKEQSNDRTGASDEFLTIDETQNHQELDMKSGV
ncbi:CD44 antigen isoform X24 [Cygnus olor]|uniref:CD44 antigen isoform X24 n=1 Tax=Cygnus olor TaxID=8869 RepID=UPI001ADE5EA9|nr:CD44 antigen isoform X24 [Cygnus olor]